MKIIIIGGVAAGAKTAAKTKRLLPEAEVHIYTKDNYVSYSACGMPYYIAGDFQDWKQLIIRTKEEFEKSGIYIHTRKKVTKIIPAEKKVLIEGIDTRETEYQEYDKLVISTGAEPVIPEYVDIKSEKIYTLRTLDDGIKLKQGMLRSKHITIIGGGYIAVELVESFVKNNKNVTLIERSQFVLSMLDEDISALVQDYILEHSENLVKIINNDTVKTIFETEKTLSIETEKGHKFNTDMLVVAAGVKPCVSIAEEAGIKLGRTGAIRVNSRMETNIKDIYACGDCVEKINMISNTPAWVPLGSTANKEGRVCAINLSGGVEDFEGIMGSAVLRYMDLNISRTGLTEKDAQKLGYDTASVIITKRDKAGYMPGVKNITIKLVADRRSHKILGAQAIGCGDADKRVNTVSIGLIRGITVEELIDVDLTYAPPFSTSIDILISAAQILKSKIG